jgi:hypothetical protein
MGRFLTVFFLFSFQLFGADRMAASPMVGDDTLFSDTVRQVADTSSAPVAAGGVAKSPDSLHKERVPADSGKNSVENTAQPPDNKNVIPSSSVKKIKLRKREYNYKQQVRLAVGMMAFIAFVMFTAQNLNPK